MTTPARKVWCVKKCTGIKRNSPPTCLFQCTVNLQTTQLRMSNHKFISHTILFFPSSFKFREIEAFWGVQIFKIRVEEIFGKVHAPKKPTKHEFSFQVRSFSRINIRGWLISMSLGWWVNSQDPAITDAKRSSILNQIMAWGSFNFPC